MTIREAREKKDWSQLKLAAEAGVAIGTITRLEAGKVTSMSVATVMKICKALDYDPALLFCKK